MGEAKFAPEQAMNFHNEVGNISDRFTESATKPVKENRVVRGFRSWIEGRKINGREMTDAVEPSAEEVATPEVQREIKPPFVEAFQKAEARLSELLDKRQEGRDANAKLMAVSPEASAKAFNGELSAAEVLQAMDEFDASGVSEAELKGIRREGLQAQVDYDKDVKDGKLISERASKTHTEWQHTETVVSVDQRRLKEGLQLFAESSTKPLNEQVAELNELAQLAKMVGKGQEQSMRLLVGLRHQAEGVLGGDGKQLDQEIADYAAAEAQQRKGAEISTKQESEVVTTETVKAKFEEIVAAAGLKEHNKTQYAEQMMKKLGVTKETDDQGREVWKVNEGSVVRSQLMLEDAVRATQEAFNTDINNEDLDTAEAAYYKAEAMLQGKALQTMAEAAVKNIATDIKAEQQADIQKTIQKLEAANKTLQTKERWAVRVAKVTNGISNAVNSGMSWLTRGLTRGIDSSEVRQAVRDRNEEIESFRSMLETN